MRERELIERTIDGSLSHDEWVELSTMIGADKILRLQKGDAQLRAHLLDLSLKDAATSASTISAQDIIAHKPQRSGVVKFLQRWGLLIGIVVLVSVVVAIVPFLGSFVGGDPASGSNSSISPMQLGIGIVLLISVGVAAWLEFSDRF